MNSVAYTKLGIIQRSRGLGGGIVIDLCQAVPRRFTLATLFIQIGHTLVPHAIESISLRYPRATIKLQGISDAKQAHALIGLFAFALRDTLPQAHFHYHQPVQLVGYQVIDTKQGNLGSVKDIYDLPQQQILAVDYRGRELLIPFHKDLVIGITHEQKRIMVQLPENFIKASL